MPVRKHPAKVIAVGINGCERGRVVLLGHTFKDNLLLSEVGLGDNPARFIHFLPLTRGTKSALRLAVACVRTPKGAHVRSDAGTGLPNISPSSTPSARRACGVDGFLCVSRRVPVFTRTTLCAPLPEPKVFALK